jgi:hypothetical protein
MHFAEELRNCCARCATECKSKALNDLRWHKTPHGTCAIPKAKPAHKLMGLDNRLGKVGSLPASSVCLRGVR